MLYYGFKKRFNSKSKTNPAKLIIEKDIMKTENANRAKMIGKIDFKTYEPYPKNPKIAKFFKEIGLADELGSGVRNIVKYTKIYSGGVPELKEDDIFRAIIPLEENYSENPNYTENYTENLNETQQKIIRLIKEKPEITQKMLVKELNLSRPAIALNIKYLKDNGHIERIGSDRKGYWKIIK